MCTFYNSTFYNNSIATLTGSLPFLMRIPAGPASLAFSLKNFEKRFWEGGSASNKFVCWRMYFIFIFERWFFWVQGPWSAALWIYHSLPLASTVLDEHSAVGLPRQTFDSWLHSWARCLLKGHFIYGASDEPFVLTQCPKAGSTLAMQFHLFEETSKALSTGPVTHFTRSWLEGTKRRWHRDILGRPETL